MTLRATLPAVVMAGQVLLLSAASGVHAQSPRQSALPPTQQTLPHDAAQAALKAGNAQRALEIAETALKTSARDAQLLFVRGVSLHSLNRLQEAEAVFADMTREFPELPEPYNNLAVVRAAQGRLDQARTALEDGVRAVPNYVVAHENLGDIHAQLAARSYRTAQKLDPANKNIGTKLKLVSEAAGEASPAPTPPAQAVPPSSRRP